MADKYWDEECPKRGGVGLTHVKAALNEKMCQYCSSAISNRPDSPPASPDAKLEQFMAPWPDIALWPTGVGALDQALRYNRLAFAHVRAAGAASASRRPILSAHHMFAAQLAQKAAEAEKSAA